MHGFSAINFLVKLRINGYFIKFIYPVFHDVCLLFIYTYINKVTMCNLLLHKSCTIGYVVAIVFLLAIRVFQIDVSLDSVFRFKV